MNKDSISEVTVDNQMNFIAKHAAHEAVFAHNGIFVSDYEHNGNDSSHSKYEIIIKDVSGVYEVFLQCPEWHLMLAKDLEFAIELAQGLVRCRVPKSIEELNDLFQHDLVAEYISEENAEVLLRMISEEALNMARIDVERAWANPVVES